MCDLLLAPARRVVREKACPLLSQTVRIVVAELGDNAETTGALFLRGSRLRLPFSRFLR